MLGALEASTMFSVYPFIEAIVSHDTQTALICASIILTSVLSFLLLMRTAIRYNGTRFGFALRVLVLMFGIGFGWPVLLVMAIPTMTIHSIVGFGKYIKFLFSC